MSLSQKKCVPCQVGAPTLKPEEIEKYQKELSEQWEVFDGDSLAQKPELRANPIRIRKEFNFEDFKQAIGFINKVADIAEEEGHHPDIRLFDYKKVGIELWTHKIGGLHENDFILAEKINQIDAD